jgi:AcrR family transcriptional regulator
MVIMEAWDYKQFERILDEFLRRGDPEDPRMVKRARILQAATELFVHHGYRKTSISDVAERAGVAKGTVYLYFKNKPEMVVFAIAEEKKKFLGRLRPILSPGRSPKERLKEWIKMVFITGSEMPLTSNVMTGDRDIMNALYQYMDAHKEQNWEAMQEAFIMHLLEQAMGPSCLTGTELKDRAKVILGLVYYPTALADPRTRRGLSMERFADLFAAMVVEGIGASGELGERPKEQEV